MSWDEWRPYVRVADRRALASKAMARRKKKGLPVEPVEVKGRTFARMVWGRAWCDHLEKFSDFANRLPRGRTYVRNGSVCHLEIASGQLHAFVMGSELYEIRVTIKKLSTSRWRAVKKQCAGEIATLLELLEGRLSDGVMAIVTDRDHGIFPLPQEITLDCSCPDWAVMCKHVAAVLYGVGVRLDERPELLFHLRGVDHEELIAAAEPNAAVVAGGKPGGRRRIAKNDLAGVFDIDLLAATSGAARSKPATETAIAKRQEPTVVLPSQSPRSATTANTSSNVAKPTKRAKTTKPGKTSKGKAKTSTSRKSAQKQ